MTKVLFKKEGDVWHTASDNALLMWQQGVFVTHITDTHVALGSLTEPLGTQPRDEIVDKYLNDNVEWASN